MNNGIAMNCLIMLFTLLLVIANYNKMANQNVFFLIFKDSIMKQEGHEALNRSPEYTGQSQTFKFEI